MPNRKKFEEFGFSTSAKNTHETNRSLGITIKKAHQITQRLEGVPFNNIDTSLISPIFESVRQRLSRNISMYGSAVLAFVEIRNKLQLVLGKEITYSEFNGVLDNIEFQSEFTVMDNGVSLVLNYKYYYKNGKVILEKYVLVPNNGVNIPPVKKILSILQYDKATLPVHLFSNNLAKESDSERAGVVQQLVLLNKMANEQFQEYNISKQMLAINTALTGTNDSKVVLAKLRQGMSILESKAFGGKLGVAEQVTAAGNSIGVVHIATTFIEVDIYQKLNMEIPDLLAKKANKHGLEVVMDEKNMIRELMLKKTQREEQWNIFFSNIGGWIDLPEDTKLEPISLEFDLITNGLIKVLENETIAIPAPTMTTAQETEEV